MVGRQNQVGDLDINLQMVEGMVANRAEQPWNQNKTRLHHQEENMGKKPTTYQAKDGGPPPNNKAPSKTHDCRNHNVE
ncbi:hypothetical protein V6N13_125947 [Hibiscus sabdariffa]